MKSAEANDSRRSHENSPHRIGEETRDEREDGRGEEGVSAPLQDAEDEAGTRERGPVGEGVHESEGGKRRLEVRLG